MPFSIALAGKGGCGKTTLAGMLVRYLVSHSKTPVLAVDADFIPNPNAHSKLMDVFDKDPSVRDRMRNNQTLHKIFNL